MVDIRKTKKCSMLLSVNRLKMMVLFSQPFLKASKGHQKRFWTLRRQENQIEIMDTTSMIRTKPAENPLRKTEVTSLTDQKAILTGSRNSFIKRI